MFCSIALLSQGVKAAASTAELMDDWDEEGEEREEGEAEQKDTEKEEEPKMVEAADSTPVSTVLTTWWS